MSTPLFIKELLDEENYRHRCALQNIRGRLDLFHETKKQVIRNRVNDRLKEALRLRSRGLKFKEVGKALGVGACRAGDMYHKALRLWNAGKL